MQYTTVFVLLVLLWFLSGSDGSSDSGGARVSETPATDPREGGDT